jgi:transposase-like protein
MGKRGPKLRFNEVTCPNPECPDYGITGRGNVIGNGTYKIKSGRVRKYICHTCNRVFCDRTNTAFYDLRTEEEKVMLALKMVLKGLSLRSISEILGIKADTVSKWLSKAAEHSEEVNKVLLSDLRISKVELDELWTFVNKKEFQEWKSMKMMGPGSG